MAALRFPNSKTGDAKVAPVNQNGELRKSLSSLFSNPAPRFITKFGNLSAMEIPTRASAALNEFSDTIRSGLRFRILDSTPEGTAVTE